MSRAWSLARCHSCGHEEVRYANVKRCRACRGPLERPESADERDAEIAALRARVADLERRIHVFQVDWILHDDAGLRMIEEAMYGRPDRHIGD